MNVSITVTLIDQVTAGAKAAKAALQDLAKAAGDQAKDAGKAATAKVEAATKAAKDTAAASAKAPAKEAADKAKAAANAPVKDAIAKAKDKAEAPAKEAAAKAKDKVAAPVPKARDDDVKLQARRPTIDYLRETGDAPRPDRSEPKGRGKALGIASLADMPDESKEAGAKTGGLVGRALSSAKTAVRNGIGNELAGRASDMVSSTVAEGLNNALNPMREKLEAMKADFPQFAPLIENIQGKFEGLAGAATGFAGEMAGRVTGSVMGRIGTMAAGLISLPGLAIIGTIAIMARWSHVKTFFEGLFNRLPAPVQAAMTKIGAILSNTPLGALARGFDGVASYVEKVFDAILNGGEERWSKLKALLVDNPLNWMGGSWDGLKSYFSNLWESIKANPREALAGLASQIVAVMKSIPSRLMNIGADMIEAILPVDLSRVRQSAQGIIDAFFEIPGKLANVGADIVAKLREGDWAGAAMSAVSAYVDGLRAILGHIATLVRDIVQAFTGINLFSVGTAAIETLKAGFEAAWGAISGWISTKAGEIRDKFKSALSFGGAVPGGQTGGSAPGLPRRAKGGPVRAGTPYIVGEEGQELFIPDGDGQIIDASRTRRMFSPISLPPSEPAPSLFGGSSASGARGTVQDGMGGMNRSTSNTNTFNITVNGAPSDDPEVFARRMWAEIERETRGLLHDGVST